MKTSKFSPLALAFSLLATPVFAENKCDVITDTNDWMMFHIQQKADTIKGQFCLSFTSEDPRIKSVIIKVDNGTGISTLAPENCLDIKGASNQILTPLVITADGDTTPLQPLGLEQATEAYAGLSQACLAEAVNPKGTPVKWIGRITVSPL